MPPANPVPPARGTNAARVSELDSEVRQLRRKVAELTSSLGESEENRRMLRETLDATLHQVELQALAIDELRLELDSANTKAAAVGGVVPDATARPALSPPTAPPKALDVRKLTLADLLPLAKGAGERLKAMQERGTEVDVELRVLRQAIQFMKDGMYWEAQVVLHGLRVAMDSHDVPPIILEEEEKPPAAAAPPANKVHTTRIPPNVPTGASKDKRARPRP